MKPNIEKTIFHSPYQIDECRSLLNESVDTSLVSYFSSKQIAGRVSKESISIRRRIDYRNSFQTVLRATLKARENGTEIISTTGLHPFVKTFLFIWFGMLILIGGTIFVVSLSSFFSKNSTVGVGLNMGVLLPLGMAIFGVALIKVGKYFAQDDAAFLKQFLIDLLNAEEINEA